MGFNGWEFVLHHRNDLVKLAEAVVPAEVNQY